MEAPIERGEVAPVSRARYERERLARETAERLLETRSRELFDLNQRLAQEVRRAEAASEAKSQFLANMSHELRTPLNAIIGYGELLLEAAQADARDGDIDDLKKVLSAATHLLQLINDVLDLSKIEAGRMDLRKRPTDVDALIREVADLVRPQAARNDTTIALALPNGGEMIETDPVKLKQCVLNLMANAAKFTSKGEIVVRAGLSGGILSIAVQYTGIGIAKEKLDQLFQPFVQLDGSAARQFGGTGLGLAVTRRLASLMGGGVTVASELGVGSTFTLYVAAGQTSNSSLI